MKNTHKIILIFLILLCMIGCGRAGNTGTIQNPTVNPTTNPTTNPTPTATPVLTPVPGNTYYVSTTGNDENPGTKNQPWRTVQKSANTLIAGDLVYIKAGTYNERVSPQNSGAVGKYITYASYPGDTVTIDGQGINLPDDLAGLFHIANKGYIIISGLRIINAGPNLNNTGILLSNSNHIIIQKNYTHNTVSSGIGVWGSNNITIDENEVVLACNVGEEECISVAGTDTFEVKNNSVHNGGTTDNGGEGIAIKDGSSNGRVFKNYVHDLPKKLGIYVDAWDKHTYNIQLYQNIVYNCNADGFAVASESGGLLENINIYNNIAYNNQLRGFTIGDWGITGVSHPMKNIKFINNTLYNNGNGTWGGGIAIDNPDIEGVVIRNNICSQNLSFQILVASPVPKANLTVDHNFIDGYRGYPQEIYGDNYVEGNPAFVNPGGADFHLQTGSPAIDRGSSIDAPSSDFDGNSRPQGGGYDIGGFEK